MLTNEARLELLKAFRGISKSELLKFVAEYMAENFVVNGHGTPIERRDFLIKFFKEELTEQTNERI